MQVDSEAGLAIRPMVRRPCRLARGLLVFALCWLALAGSALARPVPIWAIYNHENSDLPNDSVTALLVGQDGAVWVGTGGGLARLDKDGRWQTYTRASTNGGLPDDSVRALSPGQDGALWVGTVGGLARLDKDGRWQTYTRASTNGGLPDDSVWALSPGQDGALWVGTVGGLARLDKDGRWQTYTRASTNGGLPYDRVGALSPGQDGALWVGTAGGGLARLDKDGRWQTYTRDSTNGGLPSDMVYALSPGQDGALWVGIFHGGLARLDKDGRWQTYTRASTNGGLPDDSVLALSPGQDGALWVGTAGGGLARVDKDGRWQTYTRASTNGGLPDDRVSALSPGQDGALWVGTVGGLARLDKDGRWQTYTRASTNGGLPYDRVWALSPGQDAALWVGTAGGGLARLDKDGRWQTYTRASTNGGLPYDRVGALSPGQGGALWVGTAGGGLARLDKDGRWQTYTRDSTNGGLPDDSVRALSPGQDGALWVGTAGGGLARLDKDGRWQTYTRASTNGGLPNESVRALSPGQDGALWVGAGGGLARLDKDGRWQTYTRASTNGGLPDDSVLALSPGQDGALWVGTAGGGLARLDKDGRWQTYTRASTNGGLPNESVRALSPGQDGALWVGAGGGLARLDKDGRWQTYTRASTNGGLPDDSVLALSPGQDGALWVGTGGGLARLTPIGRKLAVVELVGRTGDVTQAEETVAAVAHDGDYLTEPWMFRYLWTCIGPNGQEASEVETKSAIYRAAFSQDGTYRLRVVAVDRYGNRSEPKEATFHVKLPQADTFGQWVARAWPIIVSASFGLYVCAFLALLLLAGWSRWAFRVIADEAWGKKWLNAPFALLRHFRPVQLWVLRPWFQEMRRRTRTDLRYLDPRVTNDTDAAIVASGLLKQLRVRPRVWLHGRSGMGKSSVCYAWTRDYFAEDATTLHQAMRRCGFILVPLAVRDHATVPPPEPNRPESWVIEAVRAQFWQFGFETNDLKLVGAMLRSGAFALVFDGMNEADRDIALASFARSFPSTRLLVTSQALPMIDQREQVLRQWTVWRLPETIEALRTDLLKLWLSDAAGTCLANRIAAEGISETIASGYDLRLLADLAAEDPEHAVLPTDRIGLYRAILARATGQDGRPLDLSNLKRLAWTMMMERRRRIVADDQKMLGAGMLASLAAEGVRIVRPIGTEFEFRHDQMRAFLAALWLVEEMPTLPALQKAAESAGAFGLNRRDQEELWNFTAPLLVSSDELQALWNFATKEAEERSMLLTALQVQADRRGLTLVRAAAKALEAVG